MPFVKYGKKTVPRSSPAASGAEYYLKDPDQIAALRTRPHVFS
jgi:hypothetical protein